MKNEGIDKSIIYIAHKLFASHDRLLAAQLAAYLRERFPVERLFLPFCDTEEDTIIHEQKGLYLYEEDRKRLRHVKILIALLHGPSYDDGVCMEIGFAYAMGVPVIIATTDFIGYIIGDERHEFMLADGILERMATKVIRHVSLPPKIDEPQDKYQSFVNQHVKMIQNLNDLVATSLERVGECRLKEVLKQGEPLIYVDLSGGEFTLFNHIASEIVRRLEGKGHKCYLAQRFNKDAAGSIQERITQDLIAAEAATTYLLFSEGMETPAGAAAILGFANALNRRVYLYCDAQQFTTAAGRELNRRNLMILYGATKIVGDLKELDDIVWE